MSVCVCESVGGSLMGLIPNWGSAYALEEGGRDGEDEGTILFPCYAFIFPV